jgi:hypothetical protein
MAIQSDIRVLAKQFEKMADDILEKNQDNPRFQSLVDAVAATSLALETKAEEVGDQPGGFTESQLDEIAALAKSFDESEDPFLQKQASVLDELMLTLAAPKNAVAEARKVEQDEVNRLREKYHKSRGEECYSFPKESLDKQNNAKETAAAVDKVKRFAPLEAPLSTRYAPDYPGNMMTRINDHVYQDSLTGKIYDFKAGYRTNKGNEVPGTAVENQIPDLGTVQEGHTMFSTRESLMSRYAEDEKQGVVKTDVSAGADDDLDQVKKALAAPLGGEPPFELTPEMDTIPPDAPDEPPEKPEGFDEMYQMIMSVADKSPDLAPATLQVVKNRAEELGWPEEWIGKLNRASMGVSLEDVGMAIDDPTIDYAWEAEETGAESVQLGDVGERAERSLEEIAAELRDQGMEEEAATLEGFAGVEPGRMESIEAVGSLQAVLQAF